MGITRLLLYVLLCVLLWYCSPRSPPGPALLYGRLLRLLRVLLPLLLQQKLLFLSWLLLLQPGLLLLLCLLLVLRGLLAPLLLLLFGRQQLLLLRQGLLSLRPQLLLLRQHLLLLIWLQLRPVQSTRLLLYPGVLVQLVLLPPGLLLYTNMLLLLPLPLGMLSMQLCQGSDNSPRLYISSRVRYELSTCILQMC